MPGPSGDQAGISLEGGACFPPGITWGEGLQRREGGREGLF